MKLRATLVVLALGATGAIAQDKPLSVDITDFFPPNPTKTQVTAVQSILDQSATDDFVLGVDGVISSSNRLPISDIATAHLESHPEALALQGDAGMIPNSDISNVAKCGPSPFTVDQIQHMVTEAAERHDVDISLAIAVAYAESRFDRQRNSPAGARGPMQLMPETAARFGVVDACDAPSNVEGGVRYLAWLTEQFGNPLLVAAAYNAGEGRIQEYGGVPPFHETVSYLATIINFQMGIETSPTPQASPVVASAAPALGPASRPKAPVSGILQATKPGEFVAGVMEF